MQVTQQVGGWVWARAPVPLASALSPTRLPLNLRAGVQVAFEMIFQAQLGLVEGRAGRKAQPAGLWGRGSGAGVQEEEQEGVKTKLAPAVGVSVRGCG